MWFPTWPGDVTLEVDGGQTKQLNKSLMLLFCFGTQVFLGLCFSGVDELVASPAPENGSASSSSSSSSSPRSYGTMPWCHDYPRKLRCWKGTILSIEVYERYIMPIGLIYISTTTYWGNQKQLLILKGHESSSNYQFPAKHVSFIFWLNKV